MRSIRLWLFAAAAQTSAFLSVGCDECENPFDCPRGEICRDGMCETAGSGLDGGLPIDTDSNTGSDGDTDTDTDSDSDIDYEIAWIRIEGGTFQMGSDTDFNAWAGPIHEVTVPSFEIAKTETTAGQYKICYDEGACQDPIHRTSDDTWFTWERVGADASPINGIVWDQAVKFCTWAGGRLPTEAEWEFAARNRGEDVDYPWGDDAPNCDYAVMKNPDGDTTSFCFNDNPMTVCSAAKDVTKQGVCDMAGNVYEMVQDNWHSNYQGAPTDGSAWLEGDTDVRPIRGGGFQSTGTSTSGHQLSTTYRLNWNWDTPTFDAVFDLGFRCARDVIDIDTDTTADTDTDVDTNI